MSNTVKNLEEARTLYWNKISENADFVVADILAKIQEAIEEMRISIELTNYEENPVVRQAVNVLSNMGFVVRAGEEHNGNFIISVSGWAVQKNDTQGMTL
jgi:5-enolpyruvylshikimate-3-phosphate synthase